MIPQCGVTQLWNELEVTHFRLVTFVNVTTLALQGVKIELTVLRLMTTQMRLALAILLARKVEYLP